MLKDERYVLLPHNLKDVYIYTIGRIRYEAGFDLAIKPIWYEPICKDIIYYVPDPIKKNKIEPIFSQKQALQIRDKVVQHLEKKNKTEWGREWNYRLFCELGITPPEGRFWEF